MLDHNPHLRMTARTAANDCIRRRSAAADPTSQPTQLRHKVTAAEALGLPGDAVVGFLAVLLRGVLAWGRRRRRQRRRGHWPWRSRRRQRRRWGHRRQAGRVGLAQAAGDAARRRDGAAPAVAVRLLVGAVALRGAASIDARRRRPRRRRSGRWERRAHPARPEALLLDRHSPALSGRHSRLAVGQLRGCIFARQRRRRWRRRRRRIRRIRRGRGERHGRRRGLGLRSDRRRCGRGGRQGTHVASQLARGPQPRVVALAPGSLLGAPLGILVEAWRRRRGRARRERRRRRRRRPERRRWRRQRREGRGGRRRQGAQPAAVGARVADGRARLAVACGDLGWAVVRTFQLQIVVDAGRRRGWRRTAWIVVGHASAAADRAGDPNDLAVAEALGGPVRAPAV